MAQYRPFAIWDGESTLPSGIARNQNILIGEADQEYYNLGGFDWWAGPDESLGYVIAYYDPTFTHPNPLNIPCGIGFLRSSELTDASFLSKANQLRKGQSLSNLSNANDAKTWLLANGYWTSYGEAAWTYGNSIGGSGSSNSGSGSSSGAGQWFFYSDEGSLNANPPIQDGNLIFLMRSDQNVVTETFNPNKVGGANEIYINVSDSTGTDYTSQFTNLQNNGGSITITQGANSVTYTSTTPGVFFFESQAGFFFIQTGQATQTVTSTSPFVYGDPATISFGNPTGTKHYWTAGDPSQQGQFAISANNSNQLELTTNIFISKFAKDSNGNNITDISAFISSLSVGDDIILKSTSASSNSATYNITSIGQFGSNGFNLGVSHISGSGYIHLTLWEIEFI